MKLFLVHAGFYDSNISGGFYESHTNYFVVASDIKEAKAKAKNISEFKDKKMHIDGIKQIEQVEDFDVILKKTGKLSKDDSHFTYDDIKKL